MNRLTSGILLSVVASVISFSPVQTAFAGQYSYGRPMQPAQPVKPGQPAQPVNLLVGKWTLTNNPVDASGTPCPHLPKTIEFFQDGTLMMSHIGDIHMPYKTRLTAKETEIFNARPGLKGNSLLLVRPTSEMAWTATSMVYIYTITRSELTLTIQGWPKATYKRTKGVSPEKGAVP
jgi:hypothetical protein